jgi:putative transposase
MSATLETVTKKKPKPTAEHVAAKELTREQGLSLTGPDGLLKQLTKVVIETALDQELTEHLGHPRNTPAATRLGTSATASGPRRC